MPDIMAQRGDDPIRLTSLPRLTRLLLRGDPEAISATLNITLPTVPCTALPGNPAILWLGPDEWLLLAERTSIPPWDSEAGAAFDISYRQIALLIDGAQAADAIASACPLDLSALPLNGCTRTVFGKAEIVLWRQDATRFHLETWRSFEPYVRRMLAESIAISGSSAN